MAVRVKLIGCAALGVGLWLALGACAEPAARPASAGQRAAAEVPGAWREPARYTFTVESRCGERAFLGKYRITVAGGAVTKAEGLDESARDWVASGPAGGVPTLAGLVKEWSDAFNRSADVARLESDPADKHPVQITIDPSRNSIDDEACYTITDYRE
jgi:hypothetical protein